MSEEVLTEERDGVLIMRLNRPGARNAVDHATAEALAAGIDELEARDDLRAGVLSSTGPTFCAGMDLKAFSRGEMPVIEGRGFAGLTEAPPRKPLIAAVEGHAVAGGCELVLACDLVVADRTARLGIPEVTRGLVAAGGGLIRLPRRIPAQIAMELALTGGLIDGERAARLGLVNRLVDDGGTEIAALELAAQIARNAPLAVAASKRVVRESAGWSDDEWPERQEPITQTVLDSEDAQEGARAFAEKRDPVWTGA